MPSPWIKIVPFALLFALIGCTPKGNGPVVGSGDSFVGSDPPGTYLTSFRARFRDGLDALKNGHSAGSSACTGDSLTAVGVDLFTQLPTMSERQQGICRRLLFGQLERLIALLDGASASPFRWMPANAAGGEVSKLWSGIAVTTPGKASPIEWSKSAIIDAAGSRSNGRLGNAVVGTAMMHEFLHQLPIQLDFVTADWIDGGGITDATTVDGIEGKVWLDMVGAQIYATVNAIIDFETIAPPDASPTPTPTAIPVPANNETMMEFGGAYGGGLGTFYDFGGFIGWKDGAVYNNPVTGAATCPAGYGNYAFKGLGGVDYAVRLCLKPHNVGVPAGISFFGMFGYVEGQPSPNPLTHAMACPAGTETHQFIANELDDPIYVCISRVPPSGGIASLAIGGAYGDGSFNNPATTLKSCPSGYGAHQVSGRAGRDQTFAYCFAGYQPEFLNPITNAKKCPDTFSPVNLFGKGGQDLAGVMCMKAHVPGATPAYDFGGAWGRGFRNASTNDFTCPAGFTQSPFSGSAGLDSGSYYCWRPHANDGAGVKLGGAFGTPNGNVTRVNPATMKLTCPDGYPARQILGSNDGLTDAAVSLCY